MVGMRQQKNDRILSDINFERNTILYRKCLVVLLIFALLTMTGLLYVQKLKERIPDDITVIAGQEAVIAQTGQEIDSATVGSYELDCKLFGMFSIKQVSVDVVEQQEVIPCGMPIGLYVETDGVLVVDVGQVQGADGLVYQPSFAVIKENDYIVSINGKNITRKKELTQALNESGGEAVVVGLRRDQQFVEVKVTPIKVSDGEYQIGVWVRDNSQGIGTLTYVTQDGHFGALGHGVSDMDTNEVMEVSRGLLYATNILSIVPGKSGTPGEILGYIDYHDEYVRGTITKNDQTGIFGTVNQSLVDSLQSEPVQLAFKQEIACGKAKIRTSMFGETRDYDVEIISINADNEENKQFILQVTDEELLAKTGGIVQGMSGSPILQNGKLIGAVTHVFVNDPTKGYGVFAETMLSEEEK